MTPWVFLVLVPFMGLSVYRITRLVTDDTLPPAVWLRNHLCGGWRPLRPDDDIRTDGRKRVDDEWLVPVYRWSWVPQWLTDLLSCPFCVSFWASLPVAALAWYAPLGVSAVVLGTMSAWAAGGLLAAQEWS